MAKDSLEDRDIASYIFSNKKWPPREKLKEDAISHKSPVRVIHFKSQIKSPEELKVGERYLEMNIEKGPSHEHEIIKVDMKTGWCTTMEYFEDGFACEGKFSLVDLGLIPDENGLWNTGNYLLPVKKK